MLERRTQGIGGQPPLRLGEILVGRQALEQHRLEAALARQDTQRFRGIGHSCKGVVQARQCEGRAGLCWS
jgi:hypothetical protein